LANLIANVTEKPNILENCCHYQDKSAVSSNFLPWHGIEMFTLVTIKDSIRIPPTKISLDLEESIVDELNAKFCNKIVPHCGLAISVFDLEKVGDPYVHHGDPSCSVSVVFRLIVFRPFNGEILVGKVRSCDEQNGVSVSLGFFDDVIIPPGLLPEGTRWDPHERVWVWSFGGNDMFIDLEEPIRIRILSEIFTESAPTPKEVLIAAAAAQAAATDNPMPPPTPPPSQYLNPPYRLIASIAEDGLGLLSWWNNS
jgi:DNA-directed RNA polymerase III subunit RPC8